jgi:hypothetical protein
MLEHHCRCRLIRYQMHCADAMLHGAEAADPGADRLRCLWCAANSLANAEVITRLTGLLNAKLCRRLNELWERYRAIERDAGAGEFACPALDNHITIVSRSPEGAWEERSDTVH